MKRSALVCGIALAVVNAGVATAHVFDAKTTLTIGKRPAGKIDPGQRTIISGELRSSRAECKRGKLIQLMRKQPGDDLVINRDRTDKTGDYRFVLRPRRSQTVYTRFRGTFATSYGHSHRCRGDVSRLVRIKVR